MALARDRNWDRGKTRASAATCKGGGMSRMGVVHHKERFADVTLGPCPGCELWQLDYTYEVAAQWQTPSLWHEAVEQILAEHLQECPHLQAIIDAL